MDELIAKVSADSGLNPVTARKAVIIALKFMLSDGPTDKMTAIVNGIPGAHQTIDESDLGGGSGMTGVYGDLTAIGLSMEQIQSFAPCFVAAMREKVGAKTFNDAAELVPGLSSFL